MARLVTRMVLLAHLVAILPLLQADAWSNEPESQKYSNLTARDRLSKTIEIPKRLPNGKWLSLGAANGQGTTVCNTSKELYSCFALRCSEGGGLEFAFIFNVGNYGSFPAADIYMDGTWVERLVFTAIDATSELVSAYEPSGNASLLRKMQTAKVMTVDLGFTHHFTLKGSSAEIERTLQICSAVGPARVVSDRNGNSRSDAASETPLKNRIAKITLAYRQRRGIGNTGFFQSADAVAMLRTAMAQANSDTEQARYLFESAIASIDPSRLNEKSPFFEDETKTALARLSMDLEVEYLAALEAEAVTRYYGQGISTVSIAFATSLGFELERLKLYSLADDYYSALAAIGQRYQPGTSSPLGEMLRLADSMTEVGEFALANRLTRRVITLAEKKQAVAIQIEALTVLGSIAISLGDLPLAGKHAKAALKLARQSNVELEPWQETELDELVYKSIAIAGDTSSALSRYEREFEKNVREFCNGDGSYFEHSDLSVFDGNGALAEAASVLPAFDMLSNCFRKKTVAEKTSKSPNRSTNALREIMFFHAIRGRRSDALSYMREVLTPDAFVGNGRDPALGNELFSQAIGHAYDGLVLGGHREWIFELAPTFAAYFDATRLAQFISNLDESVIPMGLMFLESGQTAAVRRMTNAFQESERTYGKKYSTRPQVCDSPGICAFFATLADLGHISGGAGQYLEMLPEEFRSSFSGAGTSSGEMRFLYYMAIDQADYYANRNSLRVAGKFLEIANDWSDKDVYSSDALSSTNTLNILTLTARVELAAGRRGKARQVSERILHAVRRKIDAGAAFGPDVVLRWSEKLQQALDTYLASLDVDREGRITPTDDALLATAFLQSSGTASMFVKLSERMAAGEGRLVRQHQELGEKLDQAYTRLAAIEGAAARSIVSEIDELEKLRRELASKMQKESPAYFNIARLHFPRLSELQASLEMNDAMLVTYASQNATYVWWITRQSADLRKLETTRAELGDKIARYRAAMDIQNSYKPVPIDLGYELFQMLFPEGGKELDGIDRIVAVPNGPFDGLPLPALVVSDPPKNTLELDELRKTRIDWLARKTAVTVLPSIGAIRMLQSRTSSKNRRYFGIGNPDYTNPIKLTGPQDEGIALPALPETADEVSQIARLFGADKDQDLLLASSASEERVKAADLSPYNVISFAAHGVFAGEAEGIDEPALVLSIPKTPVGDEDGLLKASEIAKLQLDADMVILSACNTAASSGQPGAEGLSGLARSFFFAGARNLAVTHWYIPSDATVALVTGMAERKKSQPGVRWSEALRRAQVSLIDSVGPPHNAHPASWAAFFIVGTEK